MPLCWTVNTADSSIRARPRKKPSTRPDIIQTKPRRSTRIRRPLQLAARAGSVAVALRGGDNRRVESISRNDLIEEIADALALGDLGEESVGYRICRTPEGSLLVDFEEAEFLFL